ncbi:MAG: hypothetical protein VYD19_05950 [Myxococcota bacterium]|nr:hypothetical protein [Myxococcota bacterium]
MFKSQQEMKLPAEVERPTSDGQVQLTLFPEPLEAALVRLRISTDELDQWNGKGWITYGSLRKEPLEDGEINSLCFIRDVVRRGFPQVLVEFLLSQLLRPIKVDPNRTTYSFTHGRITVPSVPTFDYILDTWLFERAREGDIESLDRFYGRISAVMDDMQRGMHLLTPPVYLDVEGVAEEISNELVQKLINEEALVIEAITESKAVGWGLDTYTLHEHECDARMLILSLEIELRGEQYHEDRPSVFEEISVQVSAQVKRVSDSWVLLGYELEWVDTDE